MQANEQSLDYDYIVIGSGFGGAVSALRLTEKGYKVLVLEKGKRLGPEDMPKSNWNLKNMYESEAVVPSTRDSQFFSYFIIN